MRSFCVILTFVFSAFIFDLSAVDIKRQSDFNQSSNLESRTFNMYRFDIRSLRFLDIVKFPNFAISVIMTPPTMTGPHLLPLAVNATVSGAAMPYNVTCVLNYSYVRSLGNNFPWTTLQVPMSGTYPNFTASLPASPGLFEFGCQCTDNTGGMTVWSTTTNNNGWAYFPPSNDDCNNAEALTSGTTVTGTNGGGSSQTGESVPGGITPFSSVWYSFTLSAPDQTLQINVAPLMAPLEIVSPVIGVYSGACFGTLVATGPGPHCLPPGTYHIQVASLSANQGAFNITATAGPSNITANINGNTAVCFGSSTTLTASGGSTYTWSNGSNTAAITVTPGSNVTYTVTVTGANSCTSTAQVSVQVNPLPTAINATLGQCETTAGSASGNFTLTNADGTVINGQSGMTVSYHSTMANANNNVSPLSSPFNSSNATIYARVTNTATGCYAIATVTLTVHPLPTGVQIQNINNSNSPSDFSVCAGSNINLQSAGPGSGTLTYNWSLPGGGALTGNPVAVASAAVAQHNGSWVVTVTDSNGCSATDQIVITVINAPVNDDCSNALPFSATGNNTCASQDITTCAANSQASVWYDYTVPANIKTLTFTLSGLTNGVLNVYNGCGGAALGNTCTSSVVIDCPTAGATYKVYVSSPAANTGNFNLNVMATPIAVSNDLCSGAISIPATPLCSFFTVQGSTTIGACPETFSTTGCGLNYLTDAIVWYTFTPPPGTTSTQFQNVTGTLSVFDACPPTNVVAGGNCISGAATVNAVAGNTYYIGIGITGGSGPVGFQIKYNVGPANDACGSANVSLGTGSTVVSTNACAGGDYSFNCNAAEYESSVWFTITVEPGNSGIQFSLTGRGSTPVSGSGAGTLFNTGCGGTVVGEACFTVGSSSQILCLLPGTYDLQISTSSANSGDFNLTVSQITGAPGAPANDNCESAANIALSLNCTTVTASGNNTNACHEIFSVGSCNFGTDPTTWHTFTVAADATSIDITNITGGAYLGIFQSSPCGGNTPVQLPGGGCITSNTSNLPVTGGSTYYIAVGHPTGSSYTFDIKQTVPPPNDTPCTAQTIGSASQNTTCCATPDITGSCAGANDASVWFKVPTASNTIAVDLTFSNASMALPFAVDVYQGGDCGSLSQLSASDFVTPCNNGSFSATISCLDFANNDLYIKVSSTAAGCGTFSLTANVRRATCTAAVDCSAAPTASVPTGGQACLPGCNLSMCGDGFCDPKGNATYYSFTVDPTTATALVIRIEGNSFTPLISIAYDCFSPFVSCFAGTITNPVPIGGGTIYVRVEAVGGLNLDDDFTVCANAFDSGAYDCYSATLDVTRPEHPDQNPNGPYCAGEVVHFCYNVDFIVSAIGTVPPDGNNCQWIQGIVPVVYEGWDLVALPLSSQGAPGGSQWLNQGAVHYNFNSPQYAPITLPNGNLGLIWGPGGLANGGDMPAGWYWASPGSGANCTDGSNPDTAWGLPGACNSVQHVNICFNLKVKEFATVAECQSASLKLTMFSFADGELGCWTSLSCALSTPLQWVGQAACNTLITITGNDKQTCTGVPVVVSATASNPAATIVLTTTDNPYVTGETLSGTYPFGNMTLLETLINTSNVPQIVEYTVYGTLPGQVCQSPPKVIKVTVYPSLDGTFNPMPAYVCRPGDCITLKINPIGGTGNYVSYIWTGPGFNGSGQTVTVCPSAPSEYTVVFTDNLGCIGVKSIEVDIKPPVIVSVDPTSLAVCKDGIVGNSQPIYGTVSSGLWPFIYTWTTPPGIVGYAVPFYDTGNDRFNLLEESSQAISGTLVLKVTDNWGCTGTADAFITIDQGPLPTFTFTPLNCGATTVDLTAHFYIGSSSTGLDRFELYACDGTFIAEKYDEISIFKDVDMNIYGNCFKLLTFTGSGCSVERRVTVPRTNGVQAVLSGNTQRCANGSAAVINVSNASAYNMFKWSDGATTSGISVSPSVTTTYTVTATETNGCTSTAARIITVHPTPVVGFSGSTSICPGQSTILTASSNIAGSTFLWTNVTTNATFNTRSITVTIAGTYTLEVTSPEGCKSVISVKVIENTTLSPKINELSLCDMMGDTLNAGSGFDKYFWSTGDTLQKIVVTAGGDYSVTVSKATCSGADTVTVINNATPVLNISPSPVTVCRTNDGFGPSFVDFNAHISPSGVSGNWSELTSSGVDLTDPSNVSFLNKPAGNYQFVFTSSGALEPCENVSDTLYVAVNACQCPQILNTGPLCNKGSSAVDMKTRKGNPVLGGTFSVISPAGINMVNGIFNPTGLQAGIYVVQWDLTPTCKPTINVTVYDSPKVSLTAAETTLCNDNATGNTTLDLNTFIASGSSAGTWKIVSGPAGSFISPATVSAEGLNKNDILIFRFITSSAQIPCRNDSIDFKIVVRDCKCPDVNITALTLCNGNNTPVDLNSPAVLTTTPAGVLGSWTSTAIGAISSGRYFNAVGITAGPYTITFRLTNAIAGCQRDFQQNITISRQPVAIAKAPVNACNVNTGNGPTIIRLSDLLESQSTSGGTWTQTSGTPLLTVTNGQIDFTGLAEGSVFKFTYSLTANAPCTPVTTEATVTVIKCDCPPVKISTPGTLCNESGLLNLNTLKVTPTGGGSWLVKNNLGNVVNTPNDILDAKGLQDGIYRITFSLVPAPAGNCKRDSTVFLKIEKQNLAVTRDTVVCNVVSSKGPSTLDFRSLLKSTTGAGKWVDEDGTDVPNFTNVSFVGKPLGKITYYYSLPSVSPCVNRLIPSTVEVIDCSCEQINLKAIPAMCTDKPSFDLKPYSDPKPGTWKATNPLVVISNGVISLNNLPAGIYEIYYELTTVPAAPCPKDKKINITVFNPKNAGSARGAEFCLGATDQINLFDRLDNEDAGGLWSVVSGGTTGFNAIAGTFNLTGRPAGSYVFKYSFTNQTPCPNDEETVTIKINDLPIADAGTDKTLNCTVQSAQIGTDLSSTGPTIVYEWKKDGIFISSQKKFTALEGGNYILTVRDTVTKCAASDRVTVILDSNLPVFTVRVDTISCFGQSGTITLSDITGGLSPYTISFDGGKTYGSALVLNNLKTGKFKIQVKDANGCINDRYPEISLKEPSLFAVNLGQDLFLNVGEDTILSIQGQYNEQTAKSVIWTANGVEIVNSKNKFSITVAPEDDTEYKVTVVNQSGCIASDIVKLSIKRVKPECVPNIITPGSSAGNSYFSINCAEVDRVTKYSIYDRWGNLLFIGENLNPAQPQTFWDGKFKGKDVVPGVYVYYLEMLFKDGTTEKRGGDVTVLK